MSMYEGRHDFGDPGDLNQGDIVRLIFRPVPPVEKCLLRKKAQNQTIYPVPDENTRSDLPLDPQLRFQLQVERLELCLVVSNSCDNVRSNLTFAPIAEYKPKNPGPYEQWREINLLATGTSTPRSFYLPASPQYGFPRSTADLSDYFPVTHDLLKETKRRLGTKRICGLTSEAVRHLQWQWGVFHSRNSREDLDWPSIEDFQLHLEAIEQQTRSGTGPKQAELSRAKSEIEAYLQKLAAAGAPQAAAPPVATPPTEDKNKGT